MFSVVAENVGLQYKLFLGQSFRSALFRMVTDSRINWESGPVQVEALRDVSFAVRAGERVALIGRNGAGKTTLLKIIAGIYTPTCGRISTTGKVAALIDPSLGTEGDATGYENIFLAGMNMGFSRAEIKHRLPEIEEFTELGNFLNLPLRTYSMGMRSRLSFAIATSIEPEILVVDEMIGTGDSAFFEKASKRIATLMDRSAILIFASHSKESVRKFCNKAILLDRGNMKAFGPVDEVIAQYEDSERRVEPSPA